MSSTSDKHPIFILNDESCDDCRKVVRIVPNWDGSRTSDGKYGLYAPQSGFIQSVFKSFEFNISI